MNELSNYSYGSPNEHKAFSMKHSAPDAISRMRYSDLDTSVRSYVDNLKAQMLDLAHKYSKKDLQELIPLMKDSDSMMYEDVIRLKTLRERYVSAFEKNKIPEEDQDTWEQYEQEKLEQIAVEILGRENVFGREAVENTFGTKLELTDIPKIPFTKAELERAKELNQFLVLRVDKAPDGKPLTIKKMNEIMTPKFQEANKGKVFFSIDDYSNELFFRQETASVRWSLVSKELLKDSTKKNFIDQTQLVIDYLKNEVFKDQEIPEPYKSAIAEFEAKKIDLANRIADTENISKEFGKLQIAILTRQTSTEAVYDTIIKYYTTNTRHLPNHSARTRTRSLEGFMIDVGFSGRNSLEVDGFDAQFKNSNLGTVFVR